MTLSKNGGIVASQSATTEAAAGTAAADSTVTGSVTADRLDLTIAGMTCGHCVSAVREVLEALPGVNVHQVGIGTASVTLDPQGASPAALVEAVREAGYQAAFAGNPSMARNDGLPQAPSGASCCSTR